MTSDPDLETVIRQALEAARAAGKDRLTQTEEAVLAALKVRPDLMASAALTAVEMVRRS
jgi:ABC-type Fe3+ transport system permease subunit